MTRAEAERLIRQKLLQRFNGRWALGLSPIPGEPMEWFTLDEMDACVADVAEKSAER